MYQLLGLLKLTKQMIKSLYREHLTEDCIFFCLVTPMELLAGSLSGIFQKKITSLRRHCEVCRVCIKICPRRSFPHLFCWKCSYGSYGYSTNRQCAGCSILQAILL